MEENQQRPAMRVEKRTTITLTGSSCGAQELIDSIQGGITGPTSRAFIQRHEGDRGHGDYFTITVT